MAKLDGGTTSGAGAPVEVWWVFIRVRPTKSGFVGARRAQTSIIIKGCVLQQGPMMPSTPGLFFLERYFEMSEYVQIYQLASPHQEKTCEVIIPYGVITQFPKNGRLFTPKYCFITPLTFDHTVKFLFTPSIFWITPS